MFLLHKCTGMLCAEKNTSETPFIPTAILLCIMLFRFLTKISSMMAQAGHPVFDADGILQKGVILRHLALPGHVEDSFAVLDQMAAWNDADPGCFLPSVMSQYTPFYKAAEHGIGRRITTYEYRRVVNYAMDKGLVQGYMQQKSSAKEEYTPSFDLTGV